MRIQSLVTALLLSLTSACVPMDPRTGDPIPRGDQRFKFERVEERAEGLEVGMRRLDVLLLLGSPAEKSEDGSTWIYLPERLGILIPAKALSLQFRGDFLEKHEYRTIILGQEL